MSLRYEVDPHNRLIVRESGRKTRLSRFRHVIEGRFKIGKGNTLLYHIKAPSIGIAKERNLPHQLKFKGNWSLTEDHNLRLTLNKWRRQTFGDELTLKGEIIKIDAHSLLFAVTQRTKENVTSTCILKFEGSWQADEYNRLIFRMRREKDRRDMLVFDGIWELGPKNRIVYHYEIPSSAKASPFAKVSGDRSEGRRNTRYKMRKKKRSLLFNGSWNYTKRGVLTYQLDLKGKSAFDFKIGKGIVKDNAIKFEIGIGISRRQKPIKKDIILYGKWRIKKGTGLIFETKYGDSHFSEMKFEAEARLINGSRIKFVLKNEKGRDLGMKFTLSKTMLKGIGESFIRFLRNRKERAVYIGAGYMW